MATPIPLSKPDITQREIDAVVDVLNTRHLVDRAAGWKNLSKMSPSWLGGGMVSAFHRVRRRCTVRWSRRALSRMMRSSPRRSPSWHRPIAFCMSGQAGLCGYRSQDDEYRRVQGRRRHYAEDHRPLSGWRHSGIRVGWWNWNSIARQHELILIEDSCEGFGGK